MSPRLGQDQPSHLDWFEDELIEHIMSVKHRHRDYAEGFNINLDKTAYDTNDTIATITITPKDRDCAMVTCRSKVTLQGIPQNQPLVVGTYNVVEQLKKTMA